MKVLSFGHIPSSKGGRQSSGLANVIYQLAYHGAEQDDVEMSLAATDVFVPYLKHDKLTIFGWTKKILVKHAFCNPFHTCKIICNTIKTKYDFGALISVPGLLMKSIFLDYAIQKIRPDVIHLHGAHSVVYYYLIPKSSKLVVTLHGNVGTDQNLPNSNLHAKVEKRLCASTRIDKLCTISSTIPEILKDAYGNIAPEVKVILNAYDDKVFKYIEPKQHSKLTLCTIASFSKLKGQERVIDALIQSGCNYRYVCIGHISDKDKIQLQNKCNDVDFEWLGVLAPSQIRELLAKCDYMILPSSSEGFGLVYLEAIACGVPVIIPKNLPLAKEGEILNASNSMMIEDCSAESISKVLPNLSSIKWNRRTISDSVISYSWDNIAKEYYSLYKSVL